MIITVSKELYSKKVLLKTCYKYTDNYYIHLTSDQYNYYIDIVLKNGEDDEYITNLIGNELIEQENREIVISETHNIREILFARAMASSIIYSDDMEERINTDINDDTAMKDWFEND